MSPRRQVTYLAAVFALLAAYDFSVRVHVGRDPSMRTMPKHDPVPLRANAASEEIRKQLAGWLPALAGSAGLSETAPDATEWQLWLVGVFRQGGERFALIAAKPQGGGETELVRLAAGEQVHGATIEAIDGDAVTIREGEEQRELPLFERENADLRSAAGQPSTTTVTPSIPTSAEPKASPPRGAGAAPTGRGKVAQPQELKPGEEIKLPWDLPVVEGEPSQPEKKR